MKIQRVLISGGGTGGHIFPAIAIADEIKRRNPKADILFIGAENRMEMRRVPKAGYKIIGLPISGIQRKLTLENLKVPFRLISSVRKARKVIKDFNPEIAIGVGGYASAPSLWAATGLGIPSMIQEQNSYAGLTNKLLSKRVNAICVAYPQMERFFSKEKIYLTGNPVRNDFLKIDSSKEEAIRFFDLDRDKKTILIFGGSLGARTLNNMMRNSTNLFRDSDQLQFIWQCGTHNYDELKTTETSKLDNVKLMPFIDRMDLAYQVADLVVCRAGALTVSELTVLGKASILVPSPNVAEDHQTKNAEALTKVNAALLSPDSDSDLNLSKLIIDTINNQELINKLELNASKLGRPNATKEIVNIAENILKD